MDQQNKRFLEKETKQEIQSVFNRKVIVKGTIWFALITVATIAGVFFYTHGWDTFRALAHIPVKFVAICFVMLFIDLMLGSWRNHIFIRKLHPEVSHWVSFRANVSNMFMGAVTPAHGGAGPAQLYVYTRNGVTFINGFAVSLINFGATLVFMPLAGLMAIVFMDTASIGGIIPGMLKYGFSFFLLFLVGFLLAFWKPILIGNLLEKAAAALGRIMPGRKERLANRAANARRSIASYQQSCAVILRENPFLFPLALLITAVLYLNKYVLQYVILLALGIHTSLLQVISVQVLIQFMIYFAPSPGGSGFAEVGISVLFSRIVPDRILPIFTLLQRSFLLFFPAIIGAWVVLRLLRKHAR